MSPARPCSPPRRRCAPAPASSGSPPCRAHRRPLGVAMPEARSSALPKRRDGGFARSAVASAGRAGGATRRDRRRPGHEPDAGRRRSLPRSLCALGKPLALDAALLHGLAPAATRRARGRHPADPAAPRGEMASPARLQRGGSRSRPARLRARSGAAAIRRVVLVKGVESHVVAPDGAAWKYRGGGAGLGVSGTGDVLAGIVGGLLARGAEPLDRLAVGRLAARRSRAAAGQEVGPIGFLAREIAGESRRCLPRCSALRSSRFPARRRPAARRGSRWSSPAVPNGTPAMITIRSPASARPWRSAMRLALPTISSKLPTSRVWTACTPHSRPSRRAAFMLAVIASIGTVRPLARDPPRGRARAGVADHRLGADDPDDLRRAFRQRVGGGRLGRGLGEMDARRIDRVGLDAAADPVHHRHRLDADIRPPRFPPTA